MNDHPGPAPHDDRKKATPAIHRYITCEKCGKRMLVEIPTGTRTHRCPICQAVFTTVFEHGRLTTRFAD